MKIYDGEKIRNVALLGHADAGKSQLASAMLYTAGITTRLGKVDDGTSVTDFDEEEIERGFSISTALANAEWN
ncbi:MAG TPA: GTP-binding protein, partial [Terriglobia bacterium]|nr:GTP-binding protein [Terriglobia bacterium]